VLGLKGKQIERHKKGIEIRKSCVTSPTEAQDVLLQRLGLSVPKYLERMKVM